MIAAIIYAPVIALIVWFVANHYGVPLGYWQTVVYVLVAKALAMYLKNDTSVELTVTNTKEADE